MFKHEGHRVKVKVTSK